MARSSKRRGSVLLLHERIEAVALDLRSVKTPARSKEAQLIGIVASRTTQCTRQKRFDPCRRHAGETVMFGIDCH